eukprot:6207874-Pleurochrysis_carterae.AAC.3
MERVREVPWSDMAVSRPVWALAAAHSASNFFLYFALSWLPTYFAYQFNLSTAGTLRSHRVIAKTCASKCGVYLSGHRNAACVFWVIEGRRAYIGSSKCGVCILAYRNAACASWILGADDAFFLGKGHPGARGKVLGT